MQGAQRRACTVQRSRGGGARGVPERSNPNLTLADYSLSLLLHLYLTLIGAHCIVFFRDEVGVDPIVDSVSICIYSRRTQVGVDLIVAQGTEAGGHTGDVATSVLIPQV